MTTKDFVDSLYRNRKWREAHEYIIDTDVKSIYPEPKKFWTKENPHISKGEKTMNIKEKREQFDGFVRNACMLYGAEYEIEYYPHACETTYKIGHYAPDVFVIRWEEVRDIRAAANDIMGTLIRRNPSAGYYFTNKPSTGLRITPIIPLTEIKDVIFNDPATIVFWADGTKTVVKCQEGDEFDPEKGLTMAIAKKVHGNKGSYCNVIKKWCEPYHEKQYERYATKINEALELLRNLPTVKFHFTSEKSDA